MFDRIVFTAAQMFRVPIAVITFEDGDRFWFKAQVGLRMFEVPRANAFCNALADDGLLAVEDASRDQRFAENPLVTGPPHIRFVAGAPIVSAEGLRIGSLCVADRVVRSLLARQAGQLTQLARSVVTLLEARQQG